MGVNLVFANTDVIARSSQARTSLVASVGVFDGFATIGIDSGVRVFVKRFVRVANPSLASSALSSLALASGRIGRVVATELNGSVDGDTISIDGFIESVRAEFLGATNGVLAKIEFDFGYNGNGVQSPSKLVVS